MVISLTLISNLRCKVRNRNCL